MSNSPKVGKSIVRVLAAVFLASVATGCSSDASRFGGLFSSGPDRMTTASIPGGNNAGPYGRDPVPRGEVASGQMGAAPQGGYDQRNTAMAQPYPQAPTARYDNVQASGARMASSPVSVQRAELSAPSAASPSRDPSTRQEAMAQPFPAAVAAPAASNGQQTASLARPSNRPDTLVTGTTKAPSNGWNTANGTSVALRPGESIATLAKRYGVPEKELLKANGLASASAATAGQQILIPSFGQPRNAARAAASEADLRKDGNLPTPARQQEQNVAVLPTSAAARDKAQGDLARITPPGGKPLPPAGGYKVQSGDSLAKIAKANGVSVAALKAANGINNESIRIGQTLAIPAAGGTAAPASDPVKTASIPPKQPAAAPVVAKLDAAPKTDTANKKPEAYKPPVATASVADIESKADKTAAPESTGIGKYRWPVRGAVIASYGQNVDGNRNDGIDISVPEGTPVKAAENGVVIYAGNGLKQLGNTVLVRHDDGKVTVYGHAAELNVQRGQKVQRGQTIATSGMSGGAARPQLHFEVRKDATPVNPATFLE